MELRDALHGYVVQGRSRFENLWCKLNKPNVPEELSNPSSIAHESGATRLKTKRKRALFRAFIALVGRIPAGKSLIDAFLGS